MSYVAMGTQGMNSALCELQLRPEERVRLRGYHTSPLNHRINPDTRRSDSQMEAQVAHYATTGQT